MYKKKIVVMLSVLLLMFVIFSVKDASAATTNRPILKQGMSGPYVKSLQADLKTIGVFYMTPTGYFGSLTKTSVVKFQKKYYLTADGIVGSQTYYKIDKLLGRVTSTSSISRGTTINRNLLIPWFNGVENIFYRDANAKVIDIETGLSFNIRRTYGYNHADCETLTATDTSTLNNIYGGQWSWTRRAVIVITNGRRIAASMAGMPHAGREDLPGDIWVNDWRTEGYGPGYNLDKIKDNNMSGHFDIHFLGSKTHGTDRVDEAHQAMVYRAAKLGY